MHRDLLKLRRDDPVFRHPRHRGVDGAVLGPEAFVLRYFGETEDRLLLVNLGRDIHLHSMFEPLLAPPEAKQWLVRWSSANLVYGGQGTPALDTQKGWLIPGETALVLAPAPS